MLNDTLELDQVQRVERRFQRRSKFAVHATTFTAYSLFCIIFLFSSQFWREFMTLPNTGDLLLIMMIWGTGFVAHLVSFVFQEAKDRAIQREIERAVVYSKRKRNLLSDDWDDDDDWNISDKQTSKRL
jgi:2TM domain